jgi:hypothetical protein
MHGLDKRATYLTLHIRNVHKKSPGGITTQIQYLQKNGRPHLKSPRWFRTNCVFNQFLGLVLNAPSFNWSWLFGFVSNRSQSRAEPTRASNLPEILKVGNKMNKVTEINWDNLEKVPVKPDPRRIWNLLCGRETTYPITKDVAHFTQINHTK